MYHFVHRAEPPFSICLISRVFVACGTLRKNPSSYLHTSAAFFRWMGRLRRTSFFYLPHQLHFFGVCSTKKFTTNNRRDNAFTSTSKR